MKKSFTLIGSILAIILLVFFSLWFYKRSYQIEGPTRMISGPLNTVYVLVDDALVKLSPDGEVLKTFNLSGAMGVDEPVADFFVEPNEDILVGFRHSQIIKFFSREERLTRVHSRLPSPFVLDDRNFKFTKDPATGLLYVADSVHHRIQIYGADEKEIRTLRSPAGKMPETPTSIPADEEGEGAGFAYRKDDPKKPFLFPNVLAVDEDRLYVADTDNWRIVIFHLDGTFDRLIPMVRSGERALLPFPVRFSRRGNTFFVIRRGGGFVGGEVVTVDLTTGEKKPVHLNEKIDPQDVLVRAADVLVSDRESMSIFRISLDGDLLGTFGRDSFNDILSLSRLKQRMYLLLSRGSLLGILVIVVLLAFLAVKDFITHKRLGPDSDTRPIAYLQRALGPVGCRRRNALLTLLPGIGQLAAGKVAQAVIFPIPLAFFLFIFIYAVIELFHGRVYVFPLAMTSGLIVAGLWAAIIINGKRLNERAAHITRFNVKDVVPMATAPLVTVAVGIICQHVWEVFVNQRHPEVSIAIQEIFREIIMRTGSGSSHTVVFAAMTPVNMFFAWGGAVAGLFTTMAWNFKLSAMKKIWTLVLGFCVGMLSWSVSATFIGTLIGGAYFLPLSQGALIGLAVHSYFRLRQLSLWIVPAAVVGAWVGYMAVLFIPYSMGFYLRLNPGEIVRIAAVVGPAYFIHLAILITSRAANRNSGDAN